MKNQFYFSLTFLFWGMITSVCTAQICPTAEISGSQTVCPNAPTNLQIAFTGTGNWNFTYTDGTTNTNVNNISANPYTLVVIPSETTTYSLVSVSNTCGAGSVSGSATVTVTPTTAIATPPSSQVACEETPFTFSVTAEGGNLQYQWFKGNTPIGGATNSTYTVSNATMAMAGNYKVQVTGDCGGLPVTSNEATLTVRKKTIITQQPNPLELSLCSGDMLSLAAAADGESLTYQWIKNNTFIPTAIANTYTINSVNSADAGIYRLDVEGACTNQSTSSVNVYINQTPNTAMAGDDQTQSSNTFIMAANAAVGGIGTWSVVSSDVGTSPMIQSPNNRNTNVTFSGIGSATLRWTISVPCSGATTFDEVILNQNAALAVQLISFEAKSTEKGTVLNWQTLQEINHHSFTIEKNAEKTAFVPIGNLKGAGNSQTIKKYNFVDASNNAAIAYYRLKILDMAGNETFSPIVSVVNTSQKPLFVVYPNPNLGIFRLQSSIPIQNITVIDPLGRQVIFLDTPHEEEISLSNLKKGLYFLKICPTFGTVYHCSFVVE